LSASPPPATGHGTQEGLSMGQDGFARASQEIAYAYERVQFFTSLMDAAHVDPWSIRLPSDITRVPLTTKMHYRANFPAGVVARGHSINGALVRRMHSSGTEAERLISVTHAYNLAERMANCLRGNPRLDFLRSAREIRTCRYAAPNCSDVECSNPRATMEDRMMPDNVLVLPVSHDVLLTPAPMLDAAADEIAAFAPNLLYVDPTHLAHLVRRLRETQRSFPQHNALAVALSFTLATRIARAQIETFVGPGVPVVDTLAMSEFGFVAMECDHGRVHLNTHDFYCEILTKRGEPAGRCTGQLCVTTLGDELSPHIRYLTGDLVRWTGSACCCGNAQPTIRIEGRKRNMMRRSDGAGVTPREVDDAVGLTPGISVYQLRQRRSGTFEFRYVPSATKAKPEPGLRDQLVELLGARDLAFERITYIPCERGGKLMSCKSELDASEIEALEWG
jgi:phenylacetate-CoA ligase